MHLHNFHLKKVKFLDRSGKIRNRKENSTGHRLIIIVSDTLRQKQALFIINGLKNIIVRSLCPEKKLLELEQYDCLYPVEKRHQLFYFP